MSHPWMPFYVADYLADTGHLSTAEHGAYDSTEVSGWRICNGKTIGSATSGASYANDNAQALFEYLWNKDAELAVVGGRGVSAAADWGGNKRLTLPDYRGYALVGLDAMGSSPANRVAALADLSDRTGTATITLTEAQLPAHDHPVSQTAAGGHGHDVYGGTGISNEVVGIGFSNAGGVGALNGVSTNNAYRTSLATGTTRIIEPVDNHTHSVSVGDAGAGEAHGNVQPSAGITVYIKL